jgi:hypothetical protein
MVPTTAGETTRDAIADEYPTCHPVTRMNVSSALLNGWLGIANACVAGIDVRDAW